jgi:hypothetical protein
MLRPDLHKNCQLPLQEPSARLESTRRVSKISNGDEATVTAAVKNLPACRASLLTSCFDSLQGRQSVFSCLSEYMDEKDARKQALPLAHAAHLLSELRIICDFVPLNSFYTSCIYLQPSAFWWQFHLRKSLIIPRLLLAACRHLRQKLTIHVRSPWGGAHYNEQARRCIKTCRFRKLLPLRLHSA